MNQAQLRVASALLWVAMARAGRRDGSPSRDTGHGLKGDHLQWLAGLLSGVLPSWDEAPLYVRGRMKGVENIVRVPFWRGLVRKVTSVLFRKITKGP